MSHTIIEVPVISADSQSKKLRVRYQGVNISVDAYRFQLKSGQVPKTISVIAGRDAEGNVVLKQDLSTILDSLYEEDCEYDFRVQSLRIDTKTHENYLSLSDEYGLFHRLYSPNSRGRQASGTTITCKVTRMEDDHIVLESPKYQEGGLIEEITSDSTGIKEEDLALFRTLHDKREHQFDAMNDHSMRGVWKSVIDKYPDSAHFIYELLQNADDAGATDVTVYLERDALYFKHNGPVQFTVTDDYDETIIPGHINAIVGVGDSTKGEAENKIGKFGVGFKAVFQYTDTPIVYSDYFKFRIENYIIPELINDDCPKRCPGETLFEIPFKNAEVAYKEIKQKLLKMEHPILFLRNLRSITWYDGARKEIEGHSFRKMLLEKMNRNGLLCEHIMEDNAGKESDMWLFSRNVKLSAGEFPVSVGYFLCSDDQGIAHIDINIRPEVFCFFPTSESFGSCFISHAPFLLVDNRQQIKQNEPVNKKLAGMIADLAADALVELRDIGLRDKSYLINRNVLSMAPLRNPWYYEDEDEAELISHERLYKPFLEKLKNSELLLGRDACYHNPSQILLPQPISLTEVISSDQMPELFAEGQKCDFMEQAPNSRESAEFNYLSNILGCQLVTPERFARALKPDFMSRQTMPWVLRLYRFLREDAREAWLQRNANIDKKTLYFRYAPIVKTDRGEWVAPYKGEEINVFFSAGEGGADYNIVDQEYFANSQALSFLKDLGLKEPDMLDYIKTIVLAKYASGGTITLANLRDDLAIVYEYAQKIEAGRLDEYMTELREKFRLHAVSTDKTKHYNRPSEIYFPTKELKAWFKGAGNKYRWNIWNPHVDFLDEDLYAPVMTRFGKEEIRDFLWKLGVMDKPRLEKRIVHRHLLSNAQLSVLEAGKYSPHDDEYGEDFMIQGLENALDNNMTRGLSIQLWNWLTTYMFEGKKELVFKFHYYKYITKVCEASFINQLKSHSWIYISQKTCRKPEEVPLEQFSSLNEYSYSPSLNDLLGIIRKTKSLREIGANDSQISTYETGEAFERFLRENGLSKKEALDVLKKHTENKKAKEEKEKQRAESSQDVPRQEMEDHTAQETFGEGAPDLGLTQAKKDTSGNSQRKEEASADEKLEKIRKQQEEDMERHVKEEQLRSQLLGFPKYSKEWFRTLLALEYIQDGNSEETFKGQGVTISFSKVQKDADSDRLYVLRYPSRVIPLEIEQIGGLTVQFTFSRDIDDVSFGFEVASVKDFTLRLKAKMADAEALSKIDWDKCTKATVQINNPVALVGKLIDAFHELDLPDGYDLKAGLRDNISFVFGPPGTGKTTTLAHRIASLINENEQCRILVLAPTNKACDVITLAVSDCCDCQGWMGRFLTTGEERIETEGLLVDKFSNLCEQDRCCVVTTMARLPYDGFRCDGDDMLLRDIQWDYVIIDEASMIPLAQIVYAIYRFPESRIIIAGDPMQIKPIVREHTWKDENIYEMVNLKSFVTPRTEPIRFEVENLSTQYRSVPEIGRVFSEFSYGGKLTHHRESGTGIKLDIKGFDFIRPINFVTFKVDKYDNVCGPKKLSSSNVHIYSVLLAVEICRYMAQQYDKSRQKRVLKIGIICPYAAQAQMIDKLLEQFGDMPQCVEISVGTIHGFQGDQCDIVFAVFNPPKGLGARPDDVMINNHNVVNVAISRARDYLFILMPQKDSPDFEKMRKLIAIGKIATADRESYSFMNADRMEEIIFKEKGFIEKNTFVTTHQMANVYSKPASRYEVRIDDSSVDIQIE